jgi:hypothetical protein
MEAFLRTTPDAAPAIQRVYASELGGLRSERCKLSGPLRAGSERRIGLLKQEPTGIGSPGATPAACPTNPRRVPLS